VGVRPHRSGDLGLKCGLVFSFSTHCTRGSDGEFVVAVICREIATRLSATILANEC
jgi:hypothetical protein